MNKITKKYYRGIPYSIIKIGRDNYLYQADDGTLYTIREIKGNPHPKRKLRKPKRDKTIIPFTLLDLIKNLKQEL